MTERMASGINRLRLDTGAKKRFGNAVKMWWKQRYNLGAISNHESEETQIEALKEATRSQRNARRSYNIISRSDPKTRQPICTVISAVDRGESIGERRVSDKKMRRTQEKFLCT